MEWTLKNMDEGIKELREEIDKTHQIGMQQTDVCVVYFAYSKARLKPEEVDADRILKLVKGIYGVASMLVELHGRASEPRKWREVHGKDDPQIFVFERIPDEELDRVVRLKELLNLVL